MEQQCCWTSRGGWGLLPPMTGVGNAEGSAIPLTGSSVGGTGCQGREVKQGGIEGLTLLSQCSQHCLPGH